MQEKVQVQDDGQKQSEGQIDLVALTTNIVSAYVSNNRVPPAEMPTLLSTVHAAIAELGSASAVADDSPDKPTPAQIRKSIKPDGLISFIDGKPYKTLKKHLTRNGLTMDGYRERFGLPKDYPSVAASYSEQRSALAKSLGLQRRKTGEVAKASETPTKARKPKKATAAE